MGWVLDLDGVVWLGDQPIPGAAHAVARLRAAGHDIVFCTNNSSEPVASVEARLARHGIPASGDVVTSAMAGASLIAPGEVVLVCGGPGIEDAVTAAGATVVRDGSADVVMVGFDRRFDYERLRAASTAVRAGARLIGTNDDATYPTAEGILPGGGSLLAAVETAGGRRGVVAGKPYAAMTQLLRARLGSSGVVVGDRPDTDGRFARALGYGFALVLSGVPSDPAVSQPVPDVVADDLVELVARALDDRLRVVRIRRPRPQARASGQLRTIASVREGLVGSRAMASNDLFKRYLDAGLAFTSLTQARAEALVKDLVKAGEVQADQARDTVTDLVERSRKTAEKLAETVRDEVTAQITNRGLASRTDLEKLEQRLASIVETATAPMRKATARTAGSATQAPAKKAPAKKAPAKKASPKQQVKRTAPQPKKAPAKKAPPKQQA